MAEVPMSNGSSHTFFPTLDVAAGAGQNTLSDLAARPHQIGPVFDPLSSTAIRAFAAATFETNYTPRGPDDIKSPMPEKPAGFSDRYLYPTLAQNERMRLTMLWYYTRDLEQDDDLLRRLQEKVDLVKEFIGWEFAICGLLDNDVYTRLVTAGLPLAILPRRESTCAHTILQPPGVSACTRPLETLAFSLARSPLTSIIVGFLHFQHGRRLEVPGLTSCRNRWPTQLRRNCPSMSF